MSEPGGHWRRRVEVADLGLGCTLGCRAGDVSQQCQFDVWAAPAARASCPAGTVAI